MIAPAGDNRSAPPGNLPSPDQGEVMSADGMRRLLERALEDEAVRDRLREDPEAVAREEGVELTPEEAEAFRDPEPEELGESLDQRVVHHIDRFAR